MKVIFNEEFLNKLTDGSLVQISHCNVGTYYKKIKIQSELLEDDYRIGDVSLRSANINSIHDLKNNKILLNLVIDEDINNLQSNSPLVVYVMYNLLGSNIEKTAFVIINTDTVGNLILTEFSLGKNLFNINLPLSNIRTKIITSQEIDTTFLEGPGQVQGANILRPLNHLDSTITRDSYFKFLKLSGGNEEIKNLTFLNINGAHKVNKAKFRRYTNLRLITYSPGISIYELGGNNLQRIPLTLKYDYEDFLTSGDNDFESIGKGVGTSNSNAIGQLKVDIDIRKVSGIANYKYLNNPMELELSGIEEGASITIQAIVNYYDALLTNKYSSLVADLTVNYVDNVVREYTSINISVDNTFNPVIPTLQKLPIAVTYSFDNYLYNSATGTYEFIESSSEVVSSSEPLVSKTRFELRYFPNQDATGNIVPVGPDRYEIQYESPEGSIIPFDLYGFLEIYSEIQGKMITLSDQITISPEYNSFKSYIDIDFGSISERLDNINGGEFIQSCRYTYKLYYQNLDTGVYEPVGTGYVNAIEDIEPGLQLDIFTNEASNVTYEISKSSNNDYFVVTYEPVIKGEEVRMDIQLRLNFYDVIRQKETTLTSKVIMLGN